MGKGMRAGKKPSMGGGGGSMQKQLQQMQAMQRKMEALQAEIEEKEIETLPFEERIKRFQQIINERYGKKES